MKTPHRWRRGSNDLEIWWSVYIQNEYRLPACMDGWWVLDVGAHIGSFSLACAERGAIVDAYEPCTEAAECWRENMTAQPSASLKQAAVWAEDGRAALNMGGTPSGYSLHWQGSAQEDVQVVSFARALTWRQWDLVKLDCEWSEYDIIGGATTAELRRARNYLIESHDPTRHWVVENMMRVAGFVPEWKRDEKTWRLVSFRRE